MTADLPPFHALHASCDRGVPENQITVSDAIQCIVVKRGGVSPTSVRNGRSPVSGGECAGILPILSSAEPHQLDGWQCKLNASGTNVCKIQSRKRNDDMCALGVCSLT